MWGHRKWKWKHGTSKKEGKKEKVTTVNMVFIFLIYLYLSEFRLVWLRWSEIVINVKRGQKGEKWKLLNMGNKKDKKGDRKENNLFVFNTKRKAETNEGVGEKDLCDDMIWAICFDFYFKNLGLFSWSSIPLASFWRNSSCRKTSIWSIRKE